MALRMSQSVRMGPDHQLIIALVMASAIGALEKTHSAKRKLINIIVAPTTAPIAGNKSTSSIKLWMTSIQTWMARSSLMSSSNGSTQSSKNTKSIWTTWKKNRWSKSRKCTNNRWMKWNKWKSRSMSTGRPSLRAKAMWPEMTSRSTDICLSEAAPIQGPNNRPLDD